MIADNEKDLRNKKIVDMHNSGATIKDIAKAVGMSNGGIHKVLNSVILKPEIAPKEQTVEVKLTGSEERFSSFVGYERTNVNEYAHKESGEVVRVAFVKGKDGGFGYFVKVGVETEKKSTASGSSIENGGGAK